MSNANLGTATFYITGNASGATNAANQANNALAQMERVVAQNWWGIQNLGLAFAALPGAVAAGTGAAIRSAIQWEDALAAAGRTTGELGESTDVYNARVRELSSGLLGLSQSIPTNALELAGIAEAAGALGVTGTANVLAFTETVANLANTTDLTAETAATNLARIAALTGVGAAGFDNLASAITTAGVTTAATESEIANLATRIAGVAQIVGLSADQVIGIAAATRSAGVQVEAGGTAIQKTFLDINAAVRQGGDDLEGWARIAGMSAADLRATFERDAGEALVSVVGNLGKLNDAGADTIGMLDSVGVSEQRQIRTLLSLAAAQNQNVNENVRLSNVLFSTGNAFEDTQLYSEMLERRYNTLSNQLIILKNQIFAAGQGLGQFFLPVVRQGVEILQLMLTTVASMPGPMKAFIAIFVGLATVMSALGAAALLVGPRILIARSALRQLQEASLQAANAQRILMAAQRTTTLAQLQAIGVTRQQALMMGVQGREAVKAAIATGNYANVQRALAAANISVNTTMLTSVTRMGTLITWAGRLAAVFGYVTLAITVATAAMAYFNRENNARKAAFEKMGRAQLDLIKAMRQEQKGVEGATRAHIEQHGYYLQVSAAAGQLGLNVDSLYGIISGGITDVDELNGTLDGLSGSLVHLADGSAISAIEAIQVLRNQYRNSSQEAGFLGGAIDDMNVNIGDTAGVSEDAADGLRKLADAATAIVDATMAYPDAVRAQESAIDGLADAERELEEARHDLANQGRDIEAAERGVAAARIDAAEAIEAVAEAEEEVASARTDARDAVAAAEDGLADAQDRRLDTLDKIQDLEEKISELRRGPELKEIAKATNDLRQAQLNLVKSHRQVADAEWYLNYIREEGGSNRDISDAELLLEEARLDEVDATEKVSETEEALNELRDQTDEMEELVDLERDLASARRDLIGVGRDIRRAEEELADARNAANGELLADRERDLERARMDAADAAETLRDAEEELVDIREGIDLIEAVEDAERGVEDAMWTLAEANVEVAKQTALMNGQQWDAADSARALARELGLLIGKSPTPDQTTRLQNFIEQLKNVPNIPIVPEIASPSMPDMGGVMGDLATALGDEFGSALDDAIQEAIDKAMEDDKEESWFDKVWGIFEEFGGDAYDFFFTTGPLLIEGLWLGIQGAAQELAGYIGRKFTEWIIDPIKRYLGIASPSTVMMGIGRDLIQGLINGLVERAVGLLKWVTELPGRIWGALGDLAGTAVTKGVDFVAGLWGGIAMRAGSLWGDIRTFAAQIIGEFTGRLFSAGTGIYDLGRSLITGLWNGIWSLKDWIWEKAKDMASDYIKDPIEQGLDWLLPGSPSKLGLAIGEGLGLGIQKSFKDIAPQVTRSAQAVAASIMDEFDAAQNIPFSVDEVLAGSRSLTANLNPGLLSSLAGTATATTIINNDTFNLEAHTDADPEDIVDSYIFKKRVRTRS